MKQMIQNYLTGKLEVADVPVPSCPDDGLLVRNVASCVSIGTERSIIELGQKSLLGKARARPDLMKRFLEKARKEGPVRTFKEALGRLDTPTSLGYSSAGIVIEAGRNIHRFAPGDRVACIGAGYASHAEYIVVPENLCCRIPEEISYEDASFGMVGIIALHGIRTARLAFGESVAVIGLGLLGLLSVEILRAYGCRVIGTDLDPRKTEKAQKLGIDAAATEKEDFRNFVRQRTGGFGADAVIITAATKSDDPVHTAVDIVRPGGRIVIVGVADIHPDRNAMWHKEVEITVSKAGGPGIFDPLYEKKGVDYPIEHVRWTENRNLEEFLRLAREGRIRLGELITHRFPIDGAGEVYDRLLSDKDGGHIGVVLTYPQAEANALTMPTSIPLPTRPMRAALAGDVGLGVIGAGLFAKALLLPALTRTKGIRLACLAAASSANAQHAAKKYGFAACTTDYSDILNDAGIEAVLILTPHRLHARMTREALEAGKHVFVEKPLCVNERELAEIYGTLSNARERFLMVGYNRRFSPHTVRIRDFLAGRTDPMVLHYRVNAGFVPADHWVHAEEEGGGRIVGEICHFIDFLQHVTQSQPVRVFAERISGSNRTALNSDNVVVTLKFDDGSIADITYSASGDRAYSREQVEIFCENTTVVSRDFRETRFFRSGKKQAFKTVSQQLGYAEELAHFVDVIRGEVQPSFGPRDLYGSTLTVFKILESLQQGSPVTLPGVR